MSDSGRIDSDGTFRLREPKADWEMLHHNGQGEAPQEMLRFSKAKGEWLIPCDGEMRTVPGVIWRALRYPVWAIIGVESVRALIALVELLTID